MRSLGLITNDRRILSLVDDRMTAVNAIPLKYQEEYLARAGEEEEEADARGLAPDERGY